MEFEYIIIEKTNHMEYDLYLTEDEVKFINYENYSTTFG